MKYDVVVEGKARIAVPKYAGGKVSSKMPVFYNPVMKSNRDITILLMTAAAKAKLYGIKKWQIADAMAATGVRGIRMVLELGSSNIELLKMNDYSAASVELIKKNLRRNMRRNKIKSGKRVVVENKDANVFLLTNRAFSYIDIDPFGYPGTFLDAAAKKIKHNGVLAVTATDTSALAGSAVAACKRKYFATPLKNGFMHETGARILVRFAQLIGAIHEKSLLPVFSYYKDHYIRAFFLCREGSGKVDQLLKMHKEIAYCGGCCEKRIIEREDGNSCGNCGRKMLIAGPLWAGRLFDTKLAATMNKIAAGKAGIDEKTKQFLSVVVEEAKLEDKTGAGFYATEEVCSKHRISRQPKTNEVVKMLRQKGYIASPTHCSTTGVKTNAPMRVVAVTVKGMAQKS